MIPDAGVVIVSLLSVLAVEFLLRMPLIAYTSNLIELYKKSLRVVLSRRISDHWKEKVLLKYSVRILKQVIYLALLFIAFFIIIVLPAYIIDYFISVSPSAMESLTSMTGIVSMSLASIIYLVLRQKFVRN